MYDCYGGYEVPNDSTDVLDGDSDSADNPDGEEGQKPAENPVTSESPEPEDNI